jgi:hypothetical protein
LEMAGLLLQYRLSFESSSYRTLGATVRDAMCSWGQRYQRVAVCTLRDYALIAART